jgi:hypothetical protein
MDWSGDDNVNLMHAARGFVGVFINKSMFGDYAEPLR